MKRRQLIKVMASSLAATLGARVTSTSAQSSGPLALMAQLSRKIAQPQTLLSPPIEQAPTLLSAPIELAGNWGHMLPHAVDQVVQRMRHACLDGIRLVSDRQPTRLRVDEHTSGSPAVWLHSDGSSMAWIIVDIGERDWTKLAYQFGHELGHVMANSWQPHAKPGPPCQWLEESLVEAFSNLGARSAGGELGSESAVRRRQCIWQVHCRLSPKYR